VRADQPLPADRAKTTLDRANRFQAGIAHRQAGNSQQGFAANAAIGRK
jgi:hypothetical protein